MPSKFVLTPIESSCYYHIYNRGIDHGTVFLRESDYYLFLKKLEFYILPISEIYAFVLLPNHYHILLRIRDDVDGLEFCHQFGRFILSFTLTINKREKRSGPLFLKTFKRLKVNHHNYLLRLVYYIHYNPENHSVCENFRYYKFSSYTSLTSNKSTLLNRIEVLNWFEDRDNFKYYHSKMRDEEKISHIIMD